MKRKTIAILTFAASISISGLSQHLKPGFDKAEYIDLMKVSAKFGSEEYYASIGGPMNYDFVYRSAVVGLDNCWDLWVNKEHNTAVISIRGTTANSASWLANIYAAMVPAQGALEFGNNETFQYNLSDNPKAAVHVGWLISTAFLSKDILPKLDSCYKTGIKDMIIMGHSQGGGIAYLVTSHLNSLQQSGAIPKDIRFKTCGSASPKPGNLYYAYSYEKLTQGGWSYNVVNSADWVPEVPFSIQTVDDFNKTNPFTDADGMIKSQKLFTRIALKKAYNDMSKPLKKAQKNYQKYLGKVASKAVVKNIEGFKEPEYYNSNHYVRTGMTIVLYADEAYYKAFPQSPDNLFTNHFHPPYLFLAEKL